jgi:hypothetical protein
MAILILSFCCFYVSGRDRVRTCNPQSRNLIFYPVELRSLKIADFGLTIIDFRLKTFEPIIQIQQSIYFILNQ